jgi:hypothetical protein
VKLLTTVKSVSTMDMKFPTATIKSPNVDMKLSFVVIKLPNWSI